ncbi:MAG TPA: hypothetical protein VJP77_09110 [Planctomycetota bacterium]|nr:hypothetical protein [Planctomycetota bacterium]
MSRVHHLREPLLDHLEDVLGERPTLRPVPVAGLPLHLEGRYAVLRGRLVGRTVLFALTGLDGGERTPARYRKELDHLEVAGGGHPAVLVLPRIDARLRRGLVRAGLPFVVPGKQLFLPQLSIDMREGFRRPRGGGHLSWAAQLVLLRHLLSRDVEGRNLSSLATLLGYTAMTMSHVREELASAGLAEHESRGRSRYLRFPIDGRGLWRRAQPLLRSPVRRTLEVRALPRGLRPLRAGLDALARRTMLAFDGTPTYAIGRRTLEGTSSRVPIAEARSESESVALLELWNHEPCALSESDLVDPLSLFLTLREDSDERVQAALEAVVEGVRW